MQTIDKLGFLPAHYVMRMENRIIALRESYPVVIVVRRILELVVQVIFMKRIFFYNYYSNENALLLVGLNDTHE